MVAAFLACAAVLGVTLVEDWGVRGAWAALAVLLGMRVITLGVRFRRRRWLVTGWSA